MAKNPGERLRRLAQKTARRKAVVAEKRKEALKVSPDLARRVQVASLCPIKLCVIDDNLFESGIGHLVFARSLPSGLVGAAFFLLDPFCLGVKNLFYKEVEAQKLTESLAFLSGEEHFVDFEPACARKLINEAASYAADLGFTSPKELSIIEPIFGNTNIQECTEAFTFGKDGKPFYIAGPNDTPARIRNIIHTLEQKVGMGRFDFIIPA